MGATGTMDASLCGIGQSTYHCWMADERREFREFREALDRETVGLTVRAIASLLAPSQRSARGALAWLAVNHPEEWGDYAPRRRRRRSTRQEPPRNVPPAQPDLSGFVLLPKGWLTPEMRAYLSPEDLAVLDAAGPSAKTEDGQAPPPRRRLSFVELGLREDAP